MKKISIYGLQRSGTNYLSALLRNHFRKVRIINSEERSHPAHKHFRLYDEKAYHPEPAFYNELYMSSLEDLEEALTPAYVPDYYLILSKSPYSWYISYLNWARKCNWPNPGYHYIEEYNRFYGKWLEHAEETHKIIFIRYPELLLNKKAALKRINSYLNLKYRLLKKPAFIKVTKSGFFTRNRFNYYKNREYLKQYSKQELEALNEKLDEKVARQLGYEVVQAENYSL